MQIFNFTYLVAAAAAVSLQANINDENDAAGTNTKVICQQAINAYGTCYESNFMMSGPVGIYQEQNCRVYCDYACQVWNGRSKDSCDDEA